MSTALKELHGYWNKWLRENINVKVSFIVSAILNDRLLKACENDFSEG